MPPRMHLPAAAETTAPCCAGLLLAGAGLELLLLGLLLMLRFRSAAYVAHRHVLLVSTFGAILAVNICFSKCWPALPLWRLWCAAACSARCVMLCTLRYAVHCMRPARPHAGCHTPPPCPPADLSGVYSHLQLHGGSAPRLLLLMLLAHPATWCMVGALTGGQTFAVNVFALPAYATLLVSASLGKGPALVAPLVCQRCMPAPPCTWVGRSA